MPATLPLSGLMSCDDRRYLFVSPPTWELSDALAELKRTCKDDDPFDRALEVMNLVAIVCLGVEDIARVLVYRPNRPGSPWIGGPSQWPSIVRAIVLSWPDRVPWSYWGEFVGACVAMYVEEKQAFVVSRAPDELKSLMEAGLAQPAIAMDPVRFNTEQRRIAATQAACWLEGEYPPPDEDEDEGWDEQDGYLTKEEISVLLDCSHRRVDQLVKEGSLCHPVNWWSRETHKWVKAPIMKDLDWLKEKANGRKRRRKKPGSLPDWL